MKILNEKVFEKLKNKYIIGPLLLAIIISSCMFTYINNFVQRVIPEEKVHISICQETSNKNNMREVWIVDDEKSSTNLAHILQTKNAQGEWEYRTAEEYSYAFDFLVSYGDNVGSSIDLNMKKSPDAVLCFLLTPNSGKVEITLEGRNKVYDLYSAESKLTYIYPYSNSKQAFLLKGVLYLFIILLLFFLINKIITIVNRGNAFEWLVIVPNRVITFLVIFVFIYLFDFVSYKGGISNFLGMGDQLYYWNVNDFFQSGILGLKQFSQEALSFRGILCNFIPYISQCIGSFININGVYIYFLFTALSASMLISVILPRIYKLLSGKEANIMQITILLILMSVFWKSLYYTVLMDLFSTTLFFTFIMFVLEFIYSNKYRYILGAAITISSAVLFRTNYSIAYKLFLLCAVTYLVIKVVGFFSKSEMINKVDNVNLPAKKLSIAIIIFVSISCIVCVPQFVVNQYKDHFGFFPYDNPGSWDNGELTLAEQSANVALSSMLTGYPFTTYDESSLGIKTELYYSDSMLNMNQILYAYEGRPLDSITVIIVRLFSGFDVKINEAYPSVKYDHSSIFYLFSTLNYLVLGSVIFMLIKTNIRRMFLNKNEITILVLVMGVVVLPQTILHIEWRYFLPGYIMFYYLFAFRFSEIISNREGIDILQKSKFFTFIVMYTVLSHLLSIILFY